MAANRAELRALELPETYEDALDTDRNLIHQAQCRRETEAQFRQLEGEGRTMRALVKHHLNLTDACAITPSPKSKWLAGSFNVCIPIEVRSTKGRLDLMLRCSMPHKLAEARYPGSVNEKMSCEVATYAWMQEHCSDIRIPHLHGFGFADNRKVRSTRP